jgi:hypothetical protein
MTTVPHKPPGKADNEWLESFNEPITYLLLIDIGNKTLQ